MAESNSNLNTVPQKIKQDLLENKESKKIFFNPKVFEFDKNDFKNGESKNTRESLFFNLNIFDSRTIESETTNREFDLFIQNEFRQRILNETLESQVPTISINPTLQEQSHLQTTFKSKTGLLANIGTARTILIDAQLDNLSAGEVSISSDEKITRIDFVPEGRARFIASKMTDSISKGINGLIELLEAIENASFDSAPILVGSTNLNMALISQRLGFRIADQCRTQTGEIDKTLSKFIVIGKLDEIKTKVEEFKNSDITQKISDRARRLKLQPQT